MKNGSIVDKLKMQEREIKESFQQPISKLTNQPLSESTNQSFSFDNAESLFSILPIGDNTDVENE